MFLEVAPPAAAADQPRLIDGFAKMLVADSALALWPQIEQAIAEQSVERTAAVTRTQERTIIAKELPRMAVSVDPALLGGAVIRNGDYLIDSSIAGRLRQLRQALAGDD